MAVRIDKTVSQRENIVNNYATLQSYLLRRAGRKLNDVEYIGLLRKNALGDLDDPGEALTNILEYVTRVDDAGEIALYGTYKPEDFEITRDFVENEITKSFLTPLRDISLAGGTAGATVATNPRIRLQDRTDLIDSFTGKGSLSNLHKGPTAIFYKTKSGKNRDVGTFRFDGGFDNTTGAALGAPTATITGGIGQYTGYKRAFMLSSYTKPNSTETVSLVGTGIYLEYDPTASTYTIGDAAALSRLKELRDILGAATFNTVVFELTQDFSALTQPTWFTASPGADTGSAPNAGGPDDFNPATTDAVIYFERGKFRLYSEPEYYNSGAYVRDRVALRYWYAYDGNNITKDSNIRYAKPPRVLSDNTYNWGVRWDGYLRIDKVATARKYIFEVETNTALKIDIYNGGTNFGNNPATITPGAWETVIDTSYNKVRKSTNVIGTGSANYADEEDRFISAESFTLTGLETGGTFKHDTTLDGSTQIRYVPISIRMWNGGPDLSDAEQETFEVPLEPNMFLKYGHSETNAGDTDSFYSSEVSIIIAANLTDVTVDAADFALMTAIMGDSDKKVVYKLVAKNEEVTKTYVDENGNEQTVTETVTSSISPVTLTLTGTNGSDIDITAAVDQQDPPQAVTLTQGTYTLQILPDKSDYSFTTLWSTKIIGPKQEEYQGYKDLIGGVTYTDGVPNWIEPLTNKLTLDQRPEWWKVSDGNRYIYSDAISKTNDPLDGFRSNYFASVLKSAQGPTYQYIGLYGDGAASNRVFATRKNLILGEAKYGSDTQGSNYVGMRLTSNYLGEGGKIKFTGIPINKANSDWTGLTGANSALVANDLGGSSNHLTIAADPNNNGAFGISTIELHYDGPATPNTCQSNKFFKHDNLGATTAPVISQDTPSTHGLPTFGGPDDAVWAQPQIINAIGTVSGGQFAAPLVLSAEKVIYNTNAGVSATSRIATDWENATYYSDFAAGTLNSGLIYLLAFTTSFDPALSGTDAIDGEIIQYYKEKDIAFQFKSVDTGESISFSDVLKLTYNVSPTSQQNTTGFNSDASEAPKVPSERVTPFGFDSPIYTQDICYPPYTTSSPSLKETIVTDSALYATGGSAKPAGNYDVIWGNHTETGLSGANFQGTAMALNIIEKLEFSYPDVTIESPANVIESLGSPPTLTDSDYSHRLKIELPIYNVANPQVALDEDIYYHIGNNERVKDVYYLFVNGREDTSDAASNLKPGMPV
jgi:hypothetical protein